MALTPLRNKGLRKRSKSAPTPPVEKRPVGFADYVRDYCKGVDLAAAQSYSALGAKLLEDLVSNSAEIKHINNSASDTAACILWCLLQRSFDDGKAFGKGMFNLTAPDNPAFVDKIYDLLTSGKDCYSRASSHYAKAAVANRGPFNINRGIDAVRHAQIPWPWKFRTVLFDKIHLKDGSVALFFKPETAGFRPFSKPAEAIEHAGHYIVTKLKDGASRGVNGLENFREKTKNPDPESLAYGRELIMVVKSGAGVSVLNDLKISTRNRASTV